MYLCFRFIHKYILFKNVTLWPSYFPDMFWRKQCVRWWSSNRYVMKNGERNDQTIWQYSTKDVRRWGGILQLNIRACFQSMQVIRLQGIGKHHYILYILKLISKKKKKNLKTSCIGNLSRWRLFPQRKFHHINNHMHFFMFVYVARLLYTFLWIWCTITYVRTYLEMKI